MCDLCKHEEASPGRRLCPTCLEAIIRLAAAVSRIGNEGVRERPAAIAATAYNPEEYKAAFLGLK